MKAKELRSKLVRMPAKIHLASLAHAGAKQELRTCEHEHQRASALSYIEHHDLERSHFKANHHVALDPIVREARLNRDRAEEDVSKRWAELERQRNLFKVSLILLNQEDSPPEKGEI